VALAVEKPRPSEGALAPVVRSCQPADWSPRSLTPLLAPGKSADPSRPDRAAGGPLAFEAECSDAPDPRPASAGRSLVVDGVSVRLLGATPAGKSGRQWPGNQCTFALSLADGSGRTLELGADRVPPFNTISSLVRDGSAVWLVLSFNGYTREFPKGGNRVLALDLCEGRVVWQSRDSTSNSALVLAGDYLLTAFGFTSEPRFVYVLDARSGAVIQKLAVVENVCPSKAWAPNYQGGRCDAPGQRVGAANNPRIEAGLFVVDTNTGSSAFQFR
jgi:hypothetical protein